MLKNTFTEKISNILPCILLDKWCDFNPDVIINQYYNLIYKLKYNQKFITLSYYKTECRI